MSNTSTEQTRSERTSLHPSDPDHPAREEVIQQPPVINPENPAVSDPTYRTSTKAVWVGMLSYGIVLVIGAVIALAVVAIL